MRVGHFHRSIVPLLIAGFAGAASLNQPFTRVAMAQPAVPQLFAAEARDIEAASARLQEFEELAGRLDKAASVSRSDFEMLQRQSQAAKSALPVLQRQLPSVVAKLKSSGKWTQALDDGIARRLQRTGQTELLQAVQAAGGVRRMLEQAAAEIPLTSAEIDATLRRLQPKAAWQRLLEPFLGQPVHAQSRKWQRIKQLFLELWQCISTSCE
jgi:hypothetical protein